MSEIKNYAPYVDESTFTIRAEDHAMEVAKKMRDRKIGALIVVKGGEKLGDIN